MEPETVLIFIVVHRIDVSLFVTLHQASALQDPPLPQPTAGKLNLLVTQEKRPFCCLMEGFLLPKSYQRVNEIAISCVHEWIYAIYVAMSPHQVFCHHVILHKS